MQNHDDTILSISVSRFSESSMYLIFCKNSESHDKNCTEYYFGGAGVQRKHDKNFHISHKMLPMATF